MNLNLYWEKIIEYFEEEDYPLNEVDDDDKTAVTYVRGDNATFRVFVWLAESSETLNLSWVFPNSVPASKNHLIFDLMHRLNYKYLVGKFTMNPENGVLSYRISHTVRGSRFSTAQFEDCMNWGIWTADEHYSKFMYLIYGDYTVDEVLEEKKRPQLRLVEKTEEQGELFEEDEACT
jgi:hypothetical protein